MNSTHANRAKPKTRRPFAPIVRPPLVMDERQRGRLAHLESLHSTVIRTVIDGLHAELARSGRDTTVLDNPIDPNDPGLKQLWEARLSYASPPVISSSSTTFIGGLGLVADHHQAPEATAAMARPVAPPAPRAPPPPPPPPRPVTTSTALQVADLPTGLPRGSALYGPLAPGEPQPRLVGSPTPLAPSAPARTLSRAR